MNKATDVPPQPQPTARYALTGLALIACGLMLWPFLPGVATGLATAAVCLPLHRRILRWTGDRDTLAAVLTTVVATLVLVIPVALVAAQLTAEARRGVEVVKEKAADEDVREQADRVPYLGEWLDKVAAGEVSVEQEARKVVARLGQTSLGVATSLASMAVQLLVAGFVLYFALKDRKHLLAAARRIAPLPDRRAGHVIARMDDAVIATVYGTVLTGVIQGVTGGLVFWALGLPAPVLWGVVMFVLAVLPVVGSGLVWVPAAVWLAAHGHWWQGAVLVGWGVLIGGPVCNYIYAVTAGDRMRLHPLPALLSFIGGLAVFGIAGMVIGPAVLALTVGLLEEQGVETDADQGAKGY
jgi:predicted PurR-regulated permease PerM